MADAAARPLPWAAPPQLLAMLYLNTAAASLGSPACLQAITDHLRAEMLHGPYAAAAQAAPALQHLYAQLAALLHCAPEQLALTESNSDGWRRVVHALAWRPGDKVVVTTGEWGGNLAVLAQLRQRCGIEVLVAPCLPDGSLDLPALAQWLVTDPHIRLLCLTWIPAHGACIYPAQAVGQLCQRYGVRYLVDAAQAAGQIPVDVQALGCDALTAPGRKWLGGPRGTGVLYLNADWLPALQPLHVDHRSCPMGPEGPQLRRDARAFESAEHALAQRLGWSAALSCHTDRDAAARHARLAALGHALRARLSSLPGVRLHDLDASAAHCAVASFSVHGYRAEQVQQALAQQHIQVAVHAPAFTPLDSHHRQLGSVVRASVHADLPADALDTLERALATLPARAH